MNNKIAVLLSTFNGEKWLPELLESLAKQDYKDIHLIWRDDGSTDATLSVLEKYKEISQTKCTHLDHRVGVAESYMHLLQHGEEEEFFAFCDQDDIWDSNKIAVAVDNLNQNTKTPLAYASKVQILGTKKVWPNFVVVPGGANALFENIMMGCTIVMNKEFRQLLLSYKKPKAFLHDEWVYFLTLIFGGLIFDQDPHIQYRLHPNNDIGLPAAQKGISMMKIRRIGRIFRHIKMYKIKKKHLKEFIYIQNSTNFFTTFENLNTPILCRRLRTVRNIRFRQNKNEDFVCRILWRVGIV